MSSFAWFRSQIVPNWFNPAETSVACSSDFSISDWTWSVFALWKEADPPTLCEFFRWACGPQRPGDRLFVLPARRAEPHLRQLLRRWERVLLGHWQKGSHKGTCRSPGKCGLLLFCVSLRQRWCSRHCDAPCMLQAALHQTQRQNGGSFLGPQAVFCQILSRLQTDGSFAVTHFVFIFPCWQSVQKTLTIWAWQEVENKMLLCRGGRTGQISTFYVQAAPLLQFIDSLEGILKTVVEVKEANVYLLSAICIKWCLRGIVCLWFDLKWKSQTGGMVRFPSLRTDLRPK